MTPTGVKNHPSAPQGRGYEVDKANRDLVRYHFKQFGRQIGVVGNSGLSTTIQMGLLLMLFLLTA